MKARVKSTGEIVEIKDLYDDGRYCPKFCVNGNGIQL